MNRFITVMLLFCCALHGKAQTWDEWFKQKETQTKYLLEQISALKMYGNAVKEGYAVVDEGLKNIGYVKEDDLQLHQEHLDALGIVKPDVTYSSTIQRIHFLLTAIISVYRECKGRVWKTGDFTNSEKAYVNAVWENILKERKAAEEEAYLLLTDNHFYLRDDERLNRLQAVAKNLEGLHLYTRGFRNTIAMASLNRIKAQKNRRKIESLY